LDFLSLLLAVCVEVSDDHTGDITLFFQLMCVFT